MPMLEARAVYTASALRSLPRLLSLLDRNPLSPTYGCFHRDYWLYKTSDFPDAVRQFGTHALALAYAHDLPGNVYRGNQNVRDWAIAGLNFWAKIQHADGSFDEFYPYERGWVGPTAFTTYACGESLRLLRADMSLEDIARVERAIRRAARFIAHGEHEEDHLANHHAMALLAVSTAADVINDAELRAAVPELWEDFLQYHDPEGWSREYDGPDPGYLSATVSFLAKVYAMQRSENAVGLGDVPRGSPVEPQQRAHAEAARAMRSDGGAARQDPTPRQIREVLAKAVDFASYFVYPDGSYGGTIGSRNTLHFYPHGFELLAAEMPLAASIAERMAQALADGKLVPPEIMSDRYVHYRVPEFLLAAVDTGKRPSVLTQLPCERPDFVRYFPRAGITTAVHGSAYTVVNLAKGGVLKSFDRQSSRLLASDTGWVGELTDGRMVTSQWVDSTAQHHAGDRLWQVSGQLHAVPSAKLFTIWTNLAFRLALGLLGWWPPAAHWLKGRIRKTLILGSTTVPCSFSRWIELTDGRITLTDELRNDGRLTFRHLLLGGDVPLRYVPQSRFFQPHELDVHSRALASDELQTINWGHSFRIVRTFEGGR